MGFGDSLKKLARSVASEMLKSGGQKGGGATRSAREEAAEKERDAEIASLPVASVQLSVTGHVTAQWSGQLHWARNDISPGEPDPTDPYADKPLVWFELFAESTACPDLGGLALRHWSFQLPGFHGDGTYDLTAINREREAAGSAPEYLAWAMAFANSDDSFYFDVGAGQSTITVSEGGKKFAGTIALSGALGQLAATTTIAL
jgi:hypothetical protein